MGGRQRRKVASPDMMDSGQRSASGWSSAWWIWVGGVTGHERGDVGRVKQTVRAWLQVLQVSEVVDVALRCHGDQPLGHLVGGGVANPCGTPIGAVNSPPAVSTCSVAPEMKRTAP